VTTLWLTLVTRRGEPYRTSAIMYRVQLPPPLTLNYLTKTYGDFGSGQPMASRWWCNADKISCV